MDKLIVKTIRRENGVIENICKCGVGHPAFGSADYLWRVSPEYKEGEDNPLGVHGCCGCCASKDWKIEDMRAGITIGNVYLIRLQNSLKALRAYNFGNLFGGA